MYKIHVSPHPLLHKGIPHGFVGRYYVKSGTTVAAGTPVSIDDAGKVFFNASFSTSATAKVFGYVVSGNMSENATHNPGSDNSKADMLVGQVTVTQNPSHVLVNGRISSGVVVVGTAVACLSQVAADKGRVTFGATSTASEVVGFIVKKILGETDMYVIQMTRQPYS